MKNFVTVLFALMLTIGAYAQQTGTESQTILIEKLEEVVVTSGVIDVAKDRQTPIAVSKITAQDIQLKVGNLEFPEVMSKIYHCSAGSKTAAGLPPINSGLP